MNKDSFLWRMHRDRYEDDPHRISIEAIPVVTSQFSPEDGIHGGHLIEVTDVVQHRIHAYCYACRVNFSFIPGEEPWKEN